MHDAPDIVLLCSTELCGIIRQTLLRVVVWYLLKSSLDSSFPLLPLVLQGLYLNVSGIEF